MGKKAAAKARARERRRGEEQRRRAVQAEMREDLGEKTLPEIDKTLHRNELFRDDDESDIPEVAVPKMKVQKVK